MFRIKILWWFYRIKSMVNLSNISKYIADEY